MMAFSKKDKSELSPPSIRYGAHQEALAHLRQHGAPTNLTDSDVTRGTLSEGVYSELIRVWRRLGLVNNDSEPEEYLHRLINADGKHSQQVLREILASSYPFLLSQDGEPLNLEKITVEELSERFMQAGTSKAAVRGCVSFFVKMAHDAGIPLPKELIREKKSIKSQVKERNGNASSVEAAGSPIEELKLEPKPSLWESHVQKFPTFDHGWKDEIIMAWLGSFDQVVYAFRSKKESESQ